MKWQLQFVSDLNLWDQAQSLQDFDHAAKKIEKQDLRNGKNIWNHKSYKVATLDVSNKSQIF